MRRCEIIVAGRRKRPVQVERRTLEGPSKSSVASFQVGKIKRPPVVDPELAPIAAEVAALLSGAPLRFPNVLWVVA